MTAAYLLKRFRGIVPSVHFAPVCDYPKPNPLGSNEPHGPVTIQPNMATITTRKSKTNRDRQIIRVRNRLRNITPIASAR